MNHQHPYHPPDVYSLRGAGGGSDDRDRLSSPFSFLSAAATASAAAWKQEHLQSLLSTLLDDHHAHEPQKHYHIRHLQSESRGQAILTFLYLCVLGLCFVTAVIYFCRMQWEERYLRRLREFERHQIRSAMAQSINGGSGSGGDDGAESRAVQRKYVEERRARIVQLFAPVRMTLAPENFAEKEEITTTGNVIDPQESEIRASAAAVADKESEAEANKNPKESASNSNNNNASTTAQGRTTNPEEEEESKFFANNNNNHHHSDNKTAAAAASEYVYGEEDESLLVEIPAPGLHLRLQTENTKPPTRWVSGMCTICLCCFEVGSDVVWSSNELCEHVFHESCIEKWLMKQREGPLCPCCRRDFIVDPYDTTENNNNGGSHQPNNDNIHDVEAATSAVADDVEEATRPSISVQAVFPANHSSSG